MTENSVGISITIRVSEREVKIENEIGIDDMEETIQGMMLEAVRWRQCWAVSINF